jgi:hypothetical protein
MTEQDWQAVIKCRDPETKELVPNPGIKRNMKYCYGDPGEGVPREDIPGLQEKD